MNTPIYTHGSTCCTLLGTILDLDANPVDLYHCTQGIDDPALHTIIARNSSDGPDYNSGRDSIMVENQIGQALAVWRGLTTPDARPKVAMCIVCDKNVKALFLGRIEKYRCTCKEDSLLYTSYNGTPQPL